MSGRIGDVGAARFRLDGDRVRASVEGTEDGVASAVVDVLVGPAPGGVRRERRISSDQANLSVVVDDTWVVKLVSEWGTADRGALQLDRLATAGSRDVPEYLGSVAWRHPDRGETTVALVTRFRAGSVDGWSWVPDALRSLPDGLPPWAAEMGEVVARLHRDLLAIDGDDRPMDARALRRRAQFSLAEACDGDAGSPSVRRLRARRDDIAAQLELIPDLLPGPVGILHGDLHVGQLLRGVDPGDDRLVVIDFDGDPQTAAGDREPRASRLVDLAHLLVSIDLAGAVAQRRSGRVIPTMAATTARVRDGVLAAYRSWSARAGCDIPLDDDVPRGLMAARLVAEHVYAERRLPEWRYAPDWAIAVRFAPDRPDEEPWTPPDSPTTSH